MVNRHFNKGAIVGGVLESHQLQSIFLVTAVTSEALLWLCVYDSYKHIYIFNKNINKVPKSRVQS